MTICKSIKPNGQIVWSIVNREGRIIGIAHSKDDAQELVKAAQQLALLAG